MKMGASSHTHFTDWERIVQERDTCEVPGNWCSMGEMDRWCDTEDCRKKLYFKSYTLQEFHFAK